MGSALFPVSHEVVRQWVGITMSGSESWWAATSSSVSIKFWRLRLSLAHGVTPLA